LLTVPGRGYRFVARVELHDESATTAVERSRQRRRHNLPALLARPIGCEEIVHEVCEEISRRRLLTLAGPGGVGKTTVAIAAAERLIDAFADGVRLVDLGSAEDPNLVPAMVASALDTPDTGSLEDAIAAVGNRSMLLLLDDCSHVVASAAAAAAQVLRGAPNIHILATSREPLRTDCERLLRVPLLATPPASPTITAEEAIRFSAVELFADRAADAAGAFHLTDCDAPLVAEICRRLDGLPLAVKLAAESVASLGVQGVADCLDDSLDLLKCGSGAAVPRQQSLRATLDWSYALLGEAERTFFGRLGVFAGGFTLRAVIAVAADATLSPGRIADTLASLVAKSLVIADTRAARFRLQETTRAYALARLAATGESSALQRRHAEHYRAMLEAAGSEVTAEGPAPDSLLVEIDNIRAALTWAFGSGGDASIGMALAVDFAPMWMDLRLLAELRGWMTKVISGLKFRIASIHTDPMTAAASATRGLSSGHQQPMMRHPGPGTGRRDGEVVLFGSSARS
jgi:predicted ATPase